VGVPEPASRAGTKAGLGDVPRPALVLGFAGLIPFLAGVAGVWTLGYPDFILALNLLMAYAAVHGVTEKTADVCLTRSR
jgi:hypothetical protein